MKIKSVTGVEYDAVPLIMRRQYALEILQGTKLVEYRAFSEKYAKMFFTKEFNDFWDKGGKPKDYDGEFFKPFDVLHFYNYNNSFNLDIEVEDISLCPMTKEACENLAKDWGLPEGDELYTAWQAFKDEKEVELMFCIKLREDIDAILNQKGFDDDVKAIIADLKQDKDEDVQKDIEGWSKLLQRP